MSAGSALHVGLRDASDSTPTQAPCGFNVFGVGFVNVVCHARDRAGQRSDLHAKKRHD